MQQWLQKRPYLLFLAPGLLLYTVFMVYPLLSSLRYSLYDWQGLVRGEFVGLSNFVEVLTQYPFAERFWSALLHNVIFFSSTFAIQTTLGLGVAVLLHQKLKGTGIYQGIFFLPYTLSQVVVGFLWLLLLNPTWGGFNELLRLVGLGEWVQPWLGQTETALGSVILVNAWRWIGFPMLVFLAGLKAIPRELEDAALVDGASWWRRFWNVTLPLLRPTIAMMTILTFIWDFNAFELVFIMQGSSGNPFYSTDLLGTFFYRTAFGDSTTGGEPGLIGIASAIAGLMLVIVGAVSVIGVRWMRKGEVQY